MDLAKRHGMGCNLFHFGQLLTPLSFAGLQNCPNLEEIRIKVEGDCRGMSMPFEHGFGLRFLGNYLSLSKMHLDCREVIGYALTAPSGQIDLGFWERFYVLGIRDLSLTELHYWPPHDRDINQRRLSSGSHITPRMLYT